MSNLTILKTAIRQFENLFCLNDLHAVSGNDPKHRPTFFVKNQQTQELIAEIQKEDLNAMPLKVLRGTQGGTYACEEIALAYAMWISPKFHLVVLRAFLAMHKGEVKPQQLALPEPPKMISIPLNTLEGLVKHARLAKQHGEELKPVMRNLFQMLGLNPYRENKFAARAHDLAYEFNTWINEGERILAQHGIKLPKLIANQGNGY